MRYLIAGGTCTLALLLTACAYHPPYTSQKDLAEMPAKMDSLTPDMTPPQILDTLHARQYMVQQESGSETCFYSSYALRPGYALMITRNLVENKVLSVVLVRPTGGYEKRLSPQKSTE